MYIIKQIPEDFIVEEIPKIDIKEEGDYTYFILEKVNWNTRKAVKAIANKLKIREKRFNIAGIKDKNAVTRQYVSVFKIGRKGLERIKIKDLKLEFVGFGDERLKLGQIEGNKFDIVVRNLDEKHAQFQSFPNYYDDQRFGGDNQIVGKALVKKDFKKACDLLNLEYQGRDYIGALRNVDRWLLRFYLNAYQSYLFNEVLKDIVKSKCKSYFKVDYNIGELFFSLKDEFIDLEIPIISFETDFKDKEIKDIYNNILTKEGITLEDFNIPQMPELFSETVYRPAFVKLKNLKISYDNDELNPGKLKAHIGFVLPSGSYATLVIKQFFSDK